MSFVLVCESREYECECVSVYNIKSEPERDFVLKENSIF